MMSINNYHSIIQNTFKQLYYSISNQSYSLLVVDLLSMSDISFIIIFAYALCTRNENEFL